MPHRRPSPGTGPSVLALMLHPAYSGYAALDGYGALAFGTSYLARAAADRAAMLVRLVRRLVRRVRPGRVVLGVAASDGPLASSLRRLARRVAKRLRLEVVVRHLREACERLGMARRSRARNGLARHLVGNFVPELFHRFGERLDRLWHRRPAWHALALAVSEFAEFAPLSAAALVPAAGHGIPSFARALRGALASHV